MEDLSVPLETLMEDNIAGTSYKMVEGRIHPKFDFEKHKK